MNDSLNFSILSTSDFPEIQKLVQKKYFDIVYDSNSKKYYISLHIMSLYNFGYDTYFDALRVAKKSKVTIKPGCLIL